MSVLTDADVASLEDLDFDVQCAIWVEHLVWGIPLPREAPCDLPARWTMRCRFCRRSAFVCDNHKKTIQASDWSVCQCGAAAAGGLVFSFWPLGGL